MLQDVVLSVELLGSASVHMAGLQTIGLSDCRLGTTLPCLPGVAGLWLSGLLVRAIAFEVSESGVGCKT